MVLHQSLELFSAYRLNEFKPKNGFLILKKPFPGCEYVRLLGNTKFSGAFFKKLPIFCQILRIGQVKAAIKNCADDPREWNCPEHRRMQVDPVGDDSKEQCHDRGKTAFNEGCHRKRR